MGTIVKSVGAGKDYTTWQAAIDSLPKNLVSDNNSYVLEGYSGTEFSSSANLVTISGFTCDSTRNITLRCAAGQSWRDRTNLQNTALAYSATSGVALRTTVNSGKLLVSDAAYLKVDGLQFKTTNYSRVLDLTGTNVTVSNCLVDALQDQYIFNMNGNNSVVSNCFLISRTAGGRGIAATNNGLVTNCTIASPSDNPGGAGSFGVVCLGSTMTVDNTAIFGFSTAGANTMTGTNNASDVALNTGLSGQSNVVYANQFVSVLNSNFDLRLKTGSSLIDAGKTTSYNTSANNLLRPSGSAYDVGAWEFSQAATALQITGPSSGVAGSPVQLSVIRNGTLSGTVTITPSDSSGGGTFNPTSASWTEGGSAPSFVYTGTEGTKSITISNNGGLSNGSALSLNLARVPTPPTSSITNQPAPDGSSLTVTFSTTNVPTSGVATLNPAASNPNGAIQTPGTVSLGANTGTASFTDIPPGNYSLVITLSNADGMNAVTGTQPVSIAGMSGNPQAPDPVTDTTAPVMQGVLASSNITETGYTLTWQAATDNTAVTGYEFSSNGTSYTDIGNTLSYVRTGLTQNTTYSNYVRAYDAAGNRSTPLTLNVKTLATYVASVVLRFKTGDNPATNLSGLKWAWFDQTDPSTFTTPTDKGSVETTDENGNILIALPNSAKTSGQIGWLIVTDSDGNPNTPHKAFSGPVAVV